MEHTSLAVTEHHQLRLVAPGAVVRRIGMRGCQHRHVAARPPHQRVQLVALVHPHRRQATRDRMVRVAHRHLERQPLSMAARLARRSVRRQLAVLVEPVRAGGFGAIAPAADANHLVECLPARERVVGGVNDHDTAAVCHVALERRLQLGRPPIVLARRS
jgi:hypothetical protein